ncbi:MAG: MarR family transcriptional regulator, partial [Aeromicrobium sp.]
MSNVSDEKLAASWHELMGRYNQLTCQLDRELGAQHDLTSSEFEVLQLLQPDGKVRMAELAEKAHLSQSALSRLVSRLEKDGLVCRNTCTDDRRAQWTEITAEADPGVRRVPRADRGCVPAVQASRRLVGPGV